MSQVEFLYLEGDNRISSAVQFFLDSFSHIRFLIWKTNHIKVIAFDVWSQGTKRK